MNEQHKFDNERAARDCVKTLRSNGKHGSIILSKEGQEGYDVHPVYFVETDPVGMIRIWETEVLTF